MAFALIDSTIKGTNSGGATTVAMDTSGANLIVLGVSYYAASPAPTVSDSKGNAWTPLPFYDFGDPGVQFHYCAAPIVGSGHTFTAAGANSYAVIAPSAWSGAAASPYESENGAGSFVAVSSLGSGNVTPVGPGSLVISAIMHLSAVSGLSVAGGGMAIIESLALSSGNYIGGGLAYEIQGAAATRAAAWSWTTASQVAVNIAVFAPAGGGGGGGATFNALLVSP